MTENTAPELTDEDLAAISASLSDEADGGFTVSVLEAWRNVLGNIESSMAERISPREANRVVGSWPKLSFQDVPAYNELYHRYLLELRDVLDEVIEGDEKAFTRVGKEDAEENAGHYRELLFQWQAVVLRWEHEWDAGADDSHIRLAAIADATGFYLNQGTGLVNHLEAIGFQYTDEDRDDAAEKLQAVREGL